jgi:ketosteroid isomerase-like protein
MTAADVVRSYLAAFETRDVAAIAAHVADGFVNEHTSALGTGCVGRDAYLQRLPGFLESMPGLHYEVEDVVAEGSRAMATYTLHARIDGRDVAVRGAMRFVLTGGLIARRTDYWDSKVFLDQIERR